MMRSLARCGSNYQNRISPRVHPMHAHGNFIASAWGRGAQPFVPRTPCRKIARLCAAQRRRFLLRKAASGQIFDLNSMARFSKQVPTTVLASAATANSSRVSKVRGRTKSRVLLYYAK